ncbi:hypothetical protein TrST_g7663 [Triparma strigata]|uniref:GOST seven transmembrane domain-containing protein n=1 Tax=Triparma strigata TaxID=1606541 RepID=A0A9W7E2K7_9STRA|nr:hypothetical protein TrST_g7663 [Triparma strigata]
MALLSALLNCRNPNRLLLRKALSLLFLFLTFDNVFCFSAHDSYSLTRQKTHLISFTPTGFGFAPGGTANLTSLSFYIAGNTDTKWNAYFLLRRYDNEERYLEEYSLAEDNKLCMATDESRMDDTDVVLDMSDPTKWQTARTVTTTFTDESQGLYFLTFQRCEPKGEGDADAIHKLSLKFHHHFCNLSPDGQCNDHLSEGEQPLPTLYTCFGFAYTLSLFLWSYTIRKAKASESTSTLSRTIRKDIKVHHVHHVMTFLLVVKVMTVYCDALRWHYIRWTGSGEAWSVFFYFFSFLKGMMLFLVILLIGSGWSFVKPFLSDKEKKIVFIVLALQVFDNIAILALSGQTEGTGSYITWSQILHLIDLVCCAAVIFPIFWQIRRLEDAVAADELAEHSIRKLTLFKQFYQLVVAYIYFTRIIALLIATNLGYRHAWLQEFMSEGVTLMFYMLVGYKFRPIEKNPYLQVKGDSDDEDEGLNLEEFGLNEGDDEDEMSNPSTGPNAL